MIFIKVTLFALHLQSVQAIWKIDNMHTWANSAKNGARENKFGSDDGDEVDDYSGVGSGELIAIFPMQVRYLVAIAQFDHSDNRTELPGFPYILRLFA